MRLLLIALLSSACGQPSAETKAVTDGRSTLKMQQFQGTDGYRLVACRNDTCQNVLLTYDNKEVVFRDSDQPADNEVSLHRLVQAKTVTEKSGGSILSDTVSIATAFVIGAGLVFIISRFPWLRHRKDSLRHVEYINKLAYIHGDRVVVKVNRTKDGLSKTYQFTDDHEKPWMLEKITKRGRATLIDDEGKKKEIMVGRKKWPPSPENWFDIISSAVGGTIGTHLLYLQKDNRLEMLADRMTADNWQAIFSRDPTVNVKIKKDIKHIVYSLAQTFDLKINSAALQ